MSVSGIGRVHWRWGTPPNPHEFFAFAGSGGAGEKKTGPQGPAPPSPAHLGARGALQQSPILRVGVWVVTAEIILARMRAMNFTASPGSKNPPVLCEMASQIGQSICYKNRTIYLLPTELFAVFPGCREADARADLMSPWESGVFPRHTQRLASGQRTCRPGKLRRWHSGFGGDRSHSMLRSGCARWPEPDRRALRGKNNEAERSSLPRQETGWNK